jgi:hypothetical protein
VIDETRLRDDLIRLLISTEKNIRTRCDEEPVVNRQIEERYQSARRAGRTGMTFSTWRENEITQAGVAWLLACVFVRFLEDNDLLGQNYLAGPGERLKTAQDRRTVWYRNHSASSDREYLLDIFAELEHLPGLKGLLGRPHNPLWSLGPDGDGAKAIWDFFQSADPDTRVLNHDFTDTVKSTRFLGDLYQNISESARKRFALLQTPDFVVDFILDRTLDEALKEFPLDDFRLIDPACGSGHFLLEAFDRLFRKWASREGELTAVVEKTLDCIYGVDLNPYAAAIARFRLLIGALQACGIKKLQSAPDWQIHVVAGDSLLFGPNKMVPSMVALAAEDPDQLRVVLQTQGYHVVVANPPYINVQDPELRRRYRDYYKSCSSKYQVSVPFTELCFALAECKGHVGMITSNAFMKRGFGKKLIEECLPKWDVTHVIDMSGAFLPGHGTPTTILFGHNGPPVAGVIRVVRGIRGELAIPVDPAAAPVWTEIHDRVDQPGFEGRYVSIADVQRQSFHHHPWSLGGGGAAELKERLDESAGRRLVGLITAAGPASFTGLDDAFIMDLSTAIRARVGRHMVRRLVSGDSVRDWHQDMDSCALTPYDQQSTLMTPSSGHGWYRHLWPYRRVAESVLSFGGRTRQQIGEPWWSWYRWISDRYAIPLSIVFAEIATHNHFVLDRGGNAFKQTAPVIKLPGTETESAHLGLLGILNSSAACFWLRQVCRNKGIRGIGGGFTTDSWEQFFAFDSTNVCQIPLPASSPLQLATAIQSAADERSALLPESIATRETPTRVSLDAARNRSAEVLLRMIALQEELDWHVYHLYGLIDESLTLPIDQVPNVQLGERAFEILMARAMDTGEVQSEWFKRHRSAPRKEIPDHWPAAYRALVQRRLDAISSDRDIALIEQPEYKRRWNIAPWEGLEQGALRKWLLDRLEDARYWPHNPPVLSSIARLADAVRGDAEFLQVAEVYRARPDFEVNDLVQELVSAESVPFLPLLRYKESGLRIRADWELTWQLQRREDAGEKVEIVPPPKYERTDFLADYWRLRGKLDVPKERWISYPYLERDTDKSPVIAWAGYDHGQQALALAGYANEMRINEGWTAERLTPVLAGLQQLQPWLDQWHNEIDPDRQQRLNESIRTFFESEMTQLGITTEKIREWCPPARVNSTKPRKARARTTAASKSPAPTE